MEGALKFLETYDKCVSRISNVLALVAGAALAVMTLLIFLDVIGRYIFNSPLPSVYEITGKLILPIIAFLGVSAAEHIRVKMLVGRLKGRGRLIVELICLFMTTAFITIMVWQTSLGAATSLRRLDTAEAIIAFPVYPAHVAVVLGLVAFWLVLMSSIIRLIKERGQVPTEGVDSTV